MPDSPQVFVRFEGFVPSGHVVMPEEDRSFSLLAKLSLLSGSWLGLLLRIWCFFTFEDVPSLVFG